MFIRQSMLSLLPEYPTIREYLNSTNITQKVKKPVNPFLKGTVKRGPSYKDANA